MNSERSAPQEPSTAMDANRERSKIAKRKLDESSFFGGVLHVCYAPEFESVQETREKLQDRRRYVARATADKDCQSIEKRKAVPEKSRLSAPVKSTFVGATPWDPTPQPDDFLPTQPPSLPPASGQDYISASPPSSYTNDPSSAASVHPPLCVRLERPNSPMQPIVVRSPATFMPRTTQLHERQRRREASLGLSLSLPDSPDIVIGPKLPELPKLDMEDDSLNTSAKLIHGKLKMISESCSKTKAEAPAAATQSAPPAKQRRRI